MPVLALCQIFKSAFLAKNSIKVTVDDFAASKCLEEKNCVPYSKISDCLNHLLLQKFCIRGCIFIA